MAGEDKKNEPKSGEPKPEDTNISPAPSEVSDGKPADGKPPEDAPKGPGPQADPLPDGTVPTVLTTGNAHRSVSKSKASLTTIYRRADILTTLFTFGGALAAALIILGVYALVTHGAKSKAPTLPSKVTNLTPADLSKLNSFFGGNSAGTSAEVLTVNSSSLFQGRVAVNSDLKVVGSAEVTNLTVDSNSTLGVVGIKGQLTVAGPATFQGAALAQNGLTVTGNVTASGNGSFGGVVSAGTVNGVTLNANSALNLSGHLNTNGSAPSISSGTIGGNDTAGEISSTATQINVTFHQAYSKLPVIMVTPTAQCPGPPDFVWKGEYFVFATGGTGFILYNPDQCPSFNYWVVQ